MEEPKLNYVKTDVLIIGAGGAGLRAAVETHNLGAKVLVVSKGKFPSPHRHHQHHVVDYE
jgi:succinate dehydrogenase/fumarate reductase flavoprotein subunit